MKLATFPFRRAFEWLDGGSVINVEQLTTSSLRVVMHLLRNTCFARLNFLDEAAARRLQTLDDLFADSFHHFIAEHWIFLGAD